MESLLEYFLPAPWESILEDDKDAMRDHASKVYQDGHVIP